MLKICIATTVHHPLDTRIYFKQVRSLSLHFTVDYYAQAFLGCDPLPSGTYFALPRATKRLDRLKTIYQLWRLLKKSHYDVYHFHDPELIPLAMYLKLRGKKIIFDVHENISAQVKNKEWIPLPFRNILSITIRFLDFFLPFFFDYLILAEDSYLQNFKKKNNIKVIHNYPFKQKKHKISYYSDLFRMIYVGDIREVRGIFQYLELVKLAKENKLDVELYLIGSYADQDINISCLEYIKNNNLENRVKHYGRIKNDEIYPILRDCDLGLALLHPIKNYLTSYPTKVFEYMSVGLPVLASDFPLWKSIIDDVNCGFTVDPLNTITAFESIKKYYDNRILLADHGHNGIIQISDKFNWNLESMKLLTVYDEVAFHL